MDWKFFESLSKLEAKRFLENFLAVESENTKHLIKQSQIDGLKVDFSIDSIEPLFKWVINRVDTIERDPDETLPEWIRKSTSYLENLFDFNEPSKILIMRIAFYLGEVFVRKYGTLSWSTGNRESAVQNMPVVTGFKHRIEMAPILVSENTISRIVVNPEKTSEIAMMIDSWENLVRS